MTRRIAWLAAADARGHLMRAHLMRTLLAAEGVRVDLITTSDDGAAFLAAMGSPSTVLSRHYRMEFDGSHNIDPKRSRRRVVRYLADPRLFLGDLRALDRLVAGADLVVNDFHPVLLVGGAFGAQRRAPVVQLFGTHLWEAVEGHFADHGPRWLAGLHARVLTNLRQRTFACVEHSLWAPPTPRGGDARHVRLPPLIARPATSRDAVRDRLGLAPHDKLAAVYLNPHFTDPEIAIAVEAALAALGLRAHLVGEGYARRPGWHATDPDLASVVAAADLFVSGAGMGALGQSHAFGTPLVALLADQPEQRRNAARESVARRHAFAGVPVRRGLPPSALAERIRAAASRVLVTGRAERDGAGARVDELHRAWTLAFLDLIEAAARDRARLDVTNRDRSSARALGRIDVAA